MTQRHYAEPAAVTNAGTARVAGVLDGGRLPTKPSARDLLQQLDADTLAQLTELLATREGKDDPAS
jgi:hypothetical protein